MVLLDKWFIIFIARERGKQGRETKSGQTDHSPVKKKKQTVELEIVKQMKLAGSKER